MAFEPVTYVDKHGFDHTAHSPSQAVAFGFKGWKPKTAAEAVQVEETVHPVPFDPSEKSAAEVHDYLIGLTDSESDVAEYDRVVAAEQSGKNRVTAVPSV